MMALYAQDPRKEYLKQKVMTASPAALLVMLYDACVKNIKLAKISLDEYGDLMATNNHLLKAQSIISELISCLDMNVGLSEDLLKLYDFMLRELRAANIKKDLSNLDALIPLLNSMAETWRELELQYRKSITIELECC
jgi:flagellar protein FliS